MQHKRKEAEVIVVGGGLAGLSAAVYLARAMRDVLVIDNGKSMARWEPDVQNYLGFPHGVGGPELLQRGKEHALHYGAKFARDEILRARKRAESFHLKGTRHDYVCQRLLIATGIFHIPPDLPALDPCLGHSMFFCKDCDGFRVRGKRVGVFGCTNEAVEYALAVVLYSPSVVVMTNGRKPRWDSQHGRWLEEYHIPFYTLKVEGVRHEGGMIRELRLQKDLHLKMDALFTTRGDIYYNKLAKSLGARVDEDGGIHIDDNHETNVQGLYAAGCVTPANCQMIIAAGEGAAAAQAINRDLFETSLANHSLRRFRRKQVREGRTKSSLKVRPSSGENPTATFQTSD